MVAHWASGDVADELFSLRRCNDKLKLKQIELLEKIDELTDKLFDTRTRLEVLDNTNILRLRRLKEVLDKYYRSDCPMCIELRMVLTKSDGDIK